MFQKYKRTKIYKYVPKITKGRICEKCTKKVLTVLKSVLKAVPKVQEPYTKSAKNVN